MNSEDFKEIDRSLSKSMDEGYVAYQKGMNKYENPYEPGSLNFDAWQSGWTIAEDSDN